MPAYIRQRPPRWFGLVAAALIIWGLLGCASFYAHVAYGPELAPDPTEWDRAYYAALPGWFDPVYAVAVLGGLLGSLALAWRWRGAELLYIASLVGVVIQFGYVFLATDVLAHKGALATVPFPLFIAAVAVFQIWFAGHARRHGWIG